VIEVIVFVVFAMAAVAGAVVMVGARNPVYSAMGLLLTLFAVAVFYVLNLGHFIAAVQVIVYAGAVMTLFLFVIMLIGVDRLDDRTEQLPAQRPAAIALGVAFLVLVLLAGRAAWVAGVTTGGPAGGIDGTIQAMAAELFDAWTLAFLGTGLLLTIAAVGTIALAQFRSGERPPADDDYAPSAVGPAAEAEG
jgi:NADH-quinone oxidoreductase subunit J